jgi:hypothetical protein
MMEDNRKTDICACDILEQVQDGDKDLNPGNSSSVLSSKLITIHNRFVSESGEETVSLLIPCLNFQSIADKFTGIKYLIPGFPGTEFLTSLV